LVRLETETTTLGISVLDVPGKVFARLALNRMSTRMTKSRPNITAMNLVKSVDAEMLSI